MILLLSIIVCVCIFRRYKIFRFNFVVHIFVINDIHICYLGIAFLEPGLTVVLESFGMNQSRMSFFTFLLFLSVLFSIPSLCIY